MIFDEEPSAEVGNIVGPFSMERISEISEDHEKSIKKFGRFISPNA